jgi:hypothetical protein
MKDIENLVIILKRGKEMYDLIQKESGKPGIPSTYASEFLPSLLFGIVLQNSLKPVVEDNTPLTPPVSFKSFEGQLDLSPMIEAVKQLSERIEALSGKIAELESQKTTQVPNQEQNQKQNQTFVPGCMHVGFDGKCVECSREKSQECSDYSCEEEIFVERAYKCKNFDECGNVYCDEHKDDLSEHGYCDDCHLCDCDGNCGDEIENGTQTRCSNPECTSDKDYCDECSKRYFNSDGKCSDCTGDKFEDCSSCGNECIKTNLTKCKNEVCDNVYCPYCVENELDEKGLCSNCVN